MTTDSRPPTLRLADYRPPDHFVDRIELTVDLDGASTRVTSRLAVRRRDGVPAGTPLALDGRDLTLVAVSLDGAPLADDAYTAHAEGLTIRTVPDAPTFTVETVARIDPDANTSLEGLYRCDAGYCTQCEAHGFRKITYFVDRPDVLAVYTTTITADAERFPVLLANGNPVEQRALDDGSGRHAATWHDPFPKPSYLFALVAGDFALTEGRHVTPSGREVALRVYTEHANRDQVDWALASLQASMRWDERTFDLECDLDSYAIVATDDFNMGAMENKGLNVFNSKYVLARPETATDGDYVGVRDVVAHEYFHNWTGNRVTCRDWFQLSLKEGLTVFREQLFSADHGSAATKRIADVRLLRAHQFPEDAGPTAHPVRPAEVIEINNFYTATVYEKGAEVVRMYHTLLGADGFARGLRHYLETYDGQAATCDEFRDAMAAANDADLSAFDRWYAQAGTPTLRLRLEADGDAAIVVHAEQTLTPGREGDEPKRPQPIPIRFAWFAPSGERLPLDDGSAEDGGAPLERTLVLDDWRASWRFSMPPTGVRPIASALRGFSAPVKLELDQSPADLAFLAAHDDDAFNRWDAGQRLVTRHVLDGVAARAGGGVTPDPQPVVEAFTTALRGAADGSLEDAFVAEMLAAPSESVLGDAMATVDVDGIHAVRSALRRAVASALCDDLESTYARLRAAETELAYEPGEATGIGRRLLANICLGYLAELDSDAAARRCRAQFDAAANMTDSLAALTCLVHHELDGADDALAAFHDRWHGQSLVLDKWLGVQASAPSSSTLDRVVALLEHASFSRTKPNKVRALIGAFAATPIAFHRLDGAGYRFVADQVVALNAINPQIAARLVGKLGSWRRYDATRQELMRTELGRIRAVDGLSKDVFEIVVKALGDSA